LLAAERGPAVAVDLAGDLSDALGLPPPAGPGVGDWLAAAPAPAPGALRRLAGPAGPHLELIGPGHLGLARLPVTESSWQRLSEELASFSDAVVVDAGGPPPRFVAEAGVASWLVIRPCYLALRRAAALPQGTATGVVVVNEPGRALSTRDVERTLQLPIVADVPIDPAVARAVDAGLLLGRMPATLARGLRGAP
jgi:hypothetical protein